ncbi:MAG: hypothetical protein U1F48_08830 [Burkholderiales bacterium]
MDKRVALAVVACAAMVSLPVHAQALAKGALVRVQVSDFGNGWHEGTVGVAPNGCTMVYLKQKALGQYTSVSLAGAGKLQEQRAGTWTDVPVKPLIAKEPKACRDGQND